MAQSVQVVRVSPGDPPFVDRVRRGVQAQFKKRFNLAARSGQSSAPARFVVQLHDKPLSHPEGFDIRTTASGQATIYTISGHGPGLLYGAGRLLREIKRQDGRIVWPRLN